LLNNMYWSWCSLCRDCIFNIFSTHWHFFVLLASWHCSPSCQEIEVCQVLAWF
jgi:hypothetical protein